MIGEDKLLRFSGVPLGEACTLVLRGATQQILDEAERSIHDALCVLASTVKETRTVYGGGTVLVFQAIRASGILPFYFNYLKILAYFHKYLSIIIK